MIINEQSEYYVYVYIDPRNFEEFYFGKGKGNRKNAHLKNNDDTEKSRRINDIYRAGLKPIIKVIARNLSENDAFLIEKTLIWKLGKNLTNLSSGHYAEKFRPHNTMHQNLSGFDFKNGLYYVNVGEGVHRQWIDCKNLGFLSAGKDTKYSDPLKSLEPGDIVVAYLKKHGYVGIGRVTDKAVKINDFMIEGKSLKYYSLQCGNMFNNAGNDKSEYILKINWVKTFDSKNAKWKSKSKLFTSQLIKASLQEQIITQKYLEEEFDVNFEELLLLDDNVNG